MSQRKYSILLTDDNQLILDGLSSILSGLEEVEKIETAGSGHEALRHPALVTADVLITDVEMPGMGGIELLKQVKQLYPDKKVVVLTMHNGAGLIREISKLQADGYLLKSTNAKEMQIAVREVLNGKKFFNQDAAVQLANGVALTEQTNKGAELTQREKEILGLLAQGFSNLQIAEKLSVSARTIETHRAHIIGKLGIQSVAGLTKFAIQNGLV